MQSLLSEHKKVDMQQPLLVHDLLRYLQCHQCHPREGVGQPSAATMGHFTSSGEDLGDEGRLPPHLNGVGRNPPEALETILLGQGTVRPYLNTRMPNWGPHWASTPAAALSSEDADPTEQPTLRDGRENAVGRNMWGRALMGIKGLGCIQCHSLGGHPSLGIQAMDRGTQPPDCAPNGFAITCSIRPAFGLEPACLPSGLMESLHCPATVAVRNARLTAFGPTFRSGTNHDFQRAWRPRVPSALQPEKTPVAFAPS